MKILLRLLILPAALLLLAPSCVREERPGGRTTGYRPGTVPIEARADLPEGWKPLLSSRAPSDVTQVIADTTLQRLGFGVYAFYTGNEEFSSSTDSSAYRNFGLVLNNRRFSYSASAWHNSGTAEFWPATDGENLTLFAYAPYSTWSSVAAYNGRSPYIVCDNFIAQSLSASELSKQRDLLWGTNTAGMPHRNAEKSDYSPEGSVDFHFRHAFAKVGLEVQGILPGDSMGEPTGGTNSTSNGADGDPTDGPVTSNVGDVVPRVTSTGSGRNTVWTLTQTITETETYTQTRYRTNTVTNTGATTTVDGYRYLVEEVTMKGFNKTGTLQLDNVSAYTPYWTGVTRFPSGTPEYVLNSSTVLTQSLQYVNASTVENNFMTYTGIQETPLDLMGGYFLYAVPRASSEGDRVALSITYHRLNVAGTVRVTRTRQVTQVATRDVARTRTKTRTSNTITQRNEPSQSSFTFNQTWDQVSWSSWGAWSSPNWGAYSDYSYGDWETTSETLVGATVNYNGDPAPTLTGEVVTSFLGGRAYTVKLIVAGDKMDLDVVPVPWQLRDFDFAYNAEINPVPQNLTYDPSTVDYCDGDEVYINNRTARFYFSLGAGKYTAWQASLVGDAAFGFTDENGEFLRDAEDNLVTSIRYGVNPGLTNNIYIRALDSSSSVTSRAKLRIYYIDATGDAVAALNLVKKDNVTEWTVVQNAN